MSNNENTNDNNESFENILSDEEMVDDDINKDFLHNIKRQPFNKISMLLGGKHTNLLTNILKGNAFRIIIDMFLNLFSFFNKRTINYGFIISFITFVIQILISKRIRAWIFSAIIFSSHIICCVCLLFFSFTKIFR